MTQTMTKEQNVIEAIKKHLETEVLLKFLKAKDKERLVWYIDTYFKPQYEQQLSAEREAHKKEIERILSAFARGENLADSLNFDGKSELDKELERAGKLVEALGIAIGVFDLTGYEKTSKILKEYIKEYQQINQDHTNPSS